MLSMRILHFPSYTGRGGPLWPPGYNITARMPITSAPGCG